MSECELRHRPIEDTLKEHKERLDEHDGKIEALQKSDAANTTNINNLCEKISGLVKVLYWFIGITVVSLLGFFFNAVQQNMR